MLSERLAICLEFKLFLKVIPMTNSAVFTHVSGNKWGNAKAEGPQGQMNIYF